MDIITYALLKNKINDVEIEMQEKKATIDLGVTSIASNNDGVVINNITDTAWDMFTENALDIYVNTDNVLKCCNYEVNDNVLIISDNYDNDICEITRNSIDDYTIEWSNNFTNINVNVIEKNIALNFEAMTNYFNNKENNIFATVNNKTLRKLNDFEKGSINGSGINTSSDNQARSINYIYCNHDIIVEPLIYSGTEIEVLYRRYELTETDNGNVFTCVGNNISDGVSTSAWINNFPFALKYDGYYRFVYNKRPLREVTNDDLRDVHIMLYNNDTKKIPYIFEYDGIDYNNSVKAIAHRGYNSTAPENTMIAFAIAAQRRWKYVETDIEFTSDDVPVLLHGETINSVARNLDGSQIESDVYINDITYDDVLMYDFGIKNGNKYAGTKIPRFDEFIDFCKAVGLHPYIELRERQYITENHITSLVDIVKSKGMLRNVTWISTSFTCLEYVRNADEYARLGVLTSSIKSSFIDNCCALLNGKNEVFVNSSKYGNDEITLCKNAELPLEIWTINAKESIEEMDSYITGVTSDSQHAGKILYYKEMNKYSNIILS